MGIPTNYDSDGDADLISSRGRSPGGGNIIPVFLPEESHGQRNLAIVNRVAKSRS